MRHPFETWPGRHRRAFFVALVVVTLASGAVLQWINADIRTDAAPNGQVSLQLAGSRAEATRVVESWQEAAVLHKAGLSLGFDYVFLLAYSTMLAAACAAVTARSRVRNWSSVAGLGALAGWGAWAAGALDAAENAFMVPIISNPAVGGSPGLVKALALGKFALLAAAAVYVVWVGVLTVRRRPTLFRSASASP